MMADGSSSGVRLVRCPRCGNLSPELSHFSTYRCGACGAFLRAKKRNELTANSVFSTVDAVTVRISHTKREADSSGAVGNETLVSAEIDLNINSNFPSGTEEGDFDVGERNGDEGMELNVNQSEAVVETGYRPESGWPLKIYLNRPKSINLSMQGGLRESAANSTRYSSCSSSRVDADQRDMIGEWFEGFPGNSSDAVGTSRITSHAYVDDGLSNHRPHSYFEHSKSVKSNVHINGLNRGESLDLDAELLRKFDDLKNHLSRISDVPGRTGETVSLDKKGPPEPFDDKFKYVSGGLLTPGKSVPVHPHLIHHPQQHPTPSISSIDRDTHDFYLPPIPGSVTMSRPYHQYVKPSYHLNNYMDLNRDFSALDSRDSSLDRTLCTCFHCHHKHEQAPQLVQPTPFGTKGTVQYTVNSISYHHHDPIQTWPQGHLGGHIPPLSSRYPWAQRRWPTESNGSDTDTAGSQQKTIAISDRSKKHYHPISGGAPFVTCCNCSELLTLPSNISVQRRKKPNLQCGSCSTALSVEVLGKRLVTSIVRQSSYLDKNGSDEAAEEKIASLQRCLGMKGIDSSGDGSAIDICSAGHGNSSFHEKYEANEESDDQQMNVQKYEQSNSPAPSSHSSEEEDVPNEVKCGTDLSTSAENALLHEESPTLPSLTFAENLDNSSSKISEDQYAEESEIKEIHRDFLVEKGVLRQKSVQDTATEAATEYSFSDFLNTSLDSSDASKEADQSKTKKRDKFFFVSLIKKSIRDFSRSNEIMEIEKPNVVINGHPIPNHLVKKAEKLAGPVLPGNYWYDFQGGFWGVMGKTCHGIIPPFIEEFNYPMPANCAAGNTKVFVNGRELHQKDLELLARRGLPTVPNRFYKIEISGGVRDEKSGKKLLRLGNLAPTVHREKHGFGMREYKQCTY